MIYHVLYALPKKSTSKNNTKSSISSMPLYSTNAKIMSVSWGSTYSNKWARAPWVVNPSAMVWKTSMGCLPKLSLQLKQVSESKRIHQILKAKQNYFQRKLSPQNEPNLKQTKPKGSPNWSYQDRNGVLLLQWYFILTGLKSMVIIHLTRLLRSRDLAQAKKAAQCCRSMSRVTIQDFD